MNKEVLARIIVDKETKCAHWIGSTKEKRPVLYVEGRQVGVRSAVYELRKGLIPRGFYVSMTCGNRDCVNSAHMELRPKGRRFRTHT